MTHTHTLYKLVTSPKRTSVVAQGKYSLTYTLNQLVTAEPCTLLFVFKDLNYAEQYYISISFPVRQRDFQLIECKSTDEPIKTHYLHYFDPSIWFDPCAWYNRRDLHYTPEEYAHHIYGVRTLTPIT